MAFQTPITIAEALRSIESREYALPAIQREFVWEHTKIARLFDSLMRGYPIGAFLFWRVGSANIKNYHFYDFMLHYHQRDRKHLSDIGECTRHEITAVLDGQQRLTALNIGLRGSYAYKLPRLWWNSRGAFPKRRLHLNILAEAEENEAGMLYDFRFLTKEYAKNARDTTHFWYPVHKILKAEGAEDIHDFLRKKQFKNQRFPFKFIPRLHEVVHTKRVIAYYEENDQDLDKVLDIFIRTNSGGTTLRYSDMLMSMATAQWKNRDAREEIHGAVDEINQIGDGFNFSKDFLLKAGLMLASVGVQFKIIHFNSDNMKRIETNWDEIKRAVYAAVELVAQFGFSQSSLTAHNAVLPIAHYLYRQGSPSGFLCRAEYQSNRIAIRFWLIRSLLKRGIWGSGLDSLLTTLRSVIDADGGDAFPSAALETSMRRQGKSLTFEEEELQDLVESKDRTFTLLTLLYPIVDLANSKFHIDHVFPKSRFSPGRLRSACVDENDVLAFQNRADRLPNLQLLEGTKNKIKSDTLPHEWMIATFGEKGALEYASRHDLGDVPADMRDFNTFYEARRDLLLNKLRRLLGVDRRGAEAEPKQP